MKAFEEIPKEEVLIEPDYKIKSMKELLDIV